MKYALFVELYSKLSSTTKRLEKIALLSSFLPSLKGHEDLVYLLRGRVFPDYDIREIGISTQLMLKALARSYGLSLEHVVGEFKRVGDLGDIAFTCCKKKKQHGLFHSSLEADYVFDRLQKLASITGKGTVDLKIGIVTELLLKATPEEARYLVRTILSDLRIGVADAIVLESIDAAFFKGEHLDKVRYAYDLLTDSAEVLRIASKGIKEFSKIKVIPGRALNVMLAVKATSIEEAFEACGKPAAFEYKYDGFRVLITYDGKEFRLFTRRLEEVTNQFPDIISYVKEHVRGKSFILDAEAVGFDAEKKRYLPFESVSQRIKRKYGIPELAKKLPVELNVFDVLYHNGEPLFDEPLSKRRALLEKIISSARWKIRLSEQLVTDSVEKAKAFYKESLHAGEEGIMVKNISVPYRPGRYVGYMVKIKPDVRDLDLVIVGAEYGTGKRAGGLTSFIVACRDNGDFKEVGMVSSGLKEKEGEGTTYKELNALLQKLIVSEKGNGVKVKPKVVVSVTYQNIQHSPTYSSGYALRFPRITHYRPERGTKDIASIEDIKREVAHAEHKRRFD